MKNERPQQKDLITELIEGIMKLITEVIETLITLLGKLIIFLTKLTLKYIQKIIFNKYPLEPITKSHLKKRKSINDVNTLGYSTNHRISVLSQDLNTKRHTAIIGSTGTGKTVCIYLLIELALKKGMPIIYFDPKASLENINTFKKICKVNNKKLYVFSDIDGASDYFNPLSGGSLGDISDKIINALEWSEPFYKNESIVALDEVLKALKSSNTFITFENILHELKKHRNFKNLASLYNQLYKVSDSEYGKLLNSTSANVLDFNKLRAEDACIYIGISAMGHSSCGSILNKVFFGGLLTHAKDSLNGKIPGFYNPQDKPIAVFFDELSSTIHAGFIDLQNKCRQAGMEITYATQGPSDIDRIDPVLTAQIFENTNNLFIFNQIVPAHTEFFAKMFGTVKAEKNTYVMEKNQKKDLGSTREVEEFLVHGNILRNLGIGQCVLLQREPKRIDLLNVRFWTPQEEINLEASKQEEAQTIF